MGRYTGTDYCSVHKLFIRGHEIATGGQNRTGNVEDWKEENWEQQLSIHAEILTEKAFLPLLIIVIYKLYAITRMYNFAINYLRRNAVRYRLY